MNHTIAVAQDFSSTLCDFFEPTDEVGKESVALLFGQHITDSVFAVTHALAPQQEGTETTVLITDEGDKEVAIWSDNNPELTLVGWAHSHHRMDRVPSVSDIRQQWYYQKSEKQSSCVYADFQLQRLFIFAFDSICHVHVDRGHCS